MLQYSPKIVTDSLVMCLDASNNKSYPTTDLPVKGGLVMWMDAADDSTFSYSSGTTVSQWRDKSGFNYHMVPVSAGPTRSSALNSRKVLTFTTAQTIQNLSIDLRLVPYTVFVVSRFTGGANNRVLTCNINATGVNWLLGHHGGTVNDYYAEGWVYDSATAADTTWRMFMGDWAKVPDLASFYSNGTALATDSNAANGAPYSLGINIYTAGASETSNCEVAEIIIFNKRISDAERKQVHTYLGQKWGISNTDRSIVDLAGNDDNGLFGNGTVANMPAYDYYNKGTLKFDGSNDYVSVGANAILRGNSISLGVFFKTINNGQSVQFIAGYGDTGVQGYWLGVVGGPIRFFVGNGSTSLQLNSGISPNNDQIYYVVGTYDGTNQRIYVDGVLMASSTSVNGSLSYTGMTDGFLIGQVQGFTGGRYLTGNIYAMQVYNRALSAVEVAQNYEAQKSKFANTIVQQGLVLNLDAGNPYSYAGAGTTWIDVSGASSVAEFVGGPAFSSADNGTIYFDGGTSYCAITPSNNFAWTPSSIGLNNMTIDLWLKSSDSTGYILSKPWNGSGEYNYYLYFNGFFINTGNQSNAFNFSTVTTGNWINLVILVSTTQWGAYINGVQNVALANHGITNNTPTYGNTQTQLTLMTLYPYGGGGNAGFSTQGNIGSFRIYNRVLSASEVLQNYNATKGRFGL